LNIAGYFDPFINLIENGLSNGFIQEKYRAIIVVESDPVKLLDLLETHEPPQGLVKWMEESQT
jgi:hypothetical protein